MTRPTAVVITASTRAAAGVYADESGPILVAGLRELGFDVDEATVVADGDPVGEALRQAIGTSANLIITSGGTGVSPTDLTPEVTAPFIDRAVPGIAEALRGDAAKRGIPMGMLSRGITGMSGSTLIINVAGSTGAARDALEVLAPVLLHAVDQIRGGVH